jgi:hypothetical protein
MYRNKYIKMRRRKKKELLPVKHTLAGREGKNK